MASFVRKIWIAFQPWVKSIGLSYAFLRGGNPPALGLRVENSETLVFGWDIAGGCERSETQNTDIGRRSDTGAFVQAQKYAARPALRFFITSTRVSRVSTDEPRGQPPDRSPSDTPVVDYLKPE